MRANDRLTSCWIGALFIIAASSAVAVSAEGPGAPAAEEPIKSMGFPPTWKPSAGAMLDWDRRGPESDLGAEFHASIYRDLLNPATAALGWAAEGYVRYVGEEPDGGLRFFLASPAAELQLGLDYSIGEDQVDFVLSLTPAFRRGGLFGVGDHLRIDWYPERDHSFMFGIGVPLGQPHMGKTRPRDKQVELPEAAASELPARSGLPAPGPGPELGAALENVRHAAKAIQSYTVPFLDREMNTDPEDLAVAKEHLREFQEHTAGVSDLYPGGHSFAAEIEVYHRELERAFALAAGGPDLVARGATLAATARAILLDRVILPYDRLLGERKKHDSLLGYGAAARRAFADSLAAQADLAAAQREAARHVFDSILATMEENRAAARKDWGDSRLVWIPLHYALRPGDIDTQAELDALIEKAAATEFTDANRLAYVVNEDAQLEIARMIRSTENYHVLWIHDYRGIDGQGDPDEIGLLMTTQAYLKALTAAVRAYDTTRQLPVFMIFIDQIYYEANQGRLYLELLADPLRHQVKLAPEFADAEQALRAAQDELAAAVAGSRALEEDAARYGRRWLENRVQVHVSVTNPADVSFRSESLVPYLNFVPDLLTHDHRKISFRDVTEEDPGRGEALFTGEGVGEHYAGPTWEDRSILVRGPAIRGLKAAARELLRTQGFKAAEIPAVLEPLPPAANYAAKAASLRERGWRDTALQVQNATGFGPKVSNVAKAILLTAMPAGSYLFTPDSLWDSPLWGAMHVGAALRGCRVFPVCPSLNNAPSEGLPQMTRTGELFTRFLLVNRFLGDQIAAQGGMLKVGVYTNDIPVGDSDRIIQAARKNLERYPFLAPAFPLHDDVMARLFALGDSLSAHGFTRQYLAADEKARMPKMHLKMNFFASAGAIAAYAMRPEWGAMLDLSMADLDGWLAGGNELSTLDRLVAVESTAERWQSTLAALTAAVDPAAHPEAVLYLTVGSQNMNYRSMILDGEVSCVAAGPSALIAYLDCLRILSLTTWVEDQQVLEALLPAPEGFMGWLGRWIKYAI